VLPLLVFVACSSDDGDDGIVDPTGGSKDTEKPVVLITHPVNDQEVSGDQLDVTITATDNHKVVKIEVYLSNNPFPVATLTAAPWETTLDISTLEAGAASVSAKAFDSTGNESNRSTIGFIKVEKGNFSFTLTDGAEFTYDRWDLDAGNMPVESSKHAYVTRLEQGDGVAMGGETDWYRMISTDAKSGGIDTLIVRTDAQHNVLVYGLANSLVERFTRQLVESGTLPEPPVLPDPVWTYLAKVNDTNGDPLTPGVQWDVTQDGGIVISFGLISATISMKATYLENGEMFSIQGKNVFSWKIGIVVTISILGQENKLPVNIWFSDDPSAQVQLIQESADLNLGLINLPVEGDMQKLVSWK
jgi:hypothetical protein